MPTRVVLRETVPSAVSSPRRVGTRAQLNSLTPPSRIGAPATALDQPFATPSKRVGFRSSILREIHKTQPRQQLHLSTTDIRASPRLLGYLFVMIASIVMLVSVIQFYQNSDQRGIFRARMLEGAADDDNDDGQFVESFGSTVLKWKLYGAGVMSGVGVVLNVFILLAHFDTVCFPKTWKSLFRDGSYKERNLLICLLVFWAAGLHICTSSFSVGSVQANVYFTTWIAFASTALNYGVWRVGADLPSLEEKLWNGKRDTTHNWMGTFIFLLVTALSISDFYANREHLTFYRDGAKIQPPQKEWIRALCLTWGSVGLALVVLWGNHSITRPYQVKFFGKDMIFLDWRHFEGLVIVGMIAQYAWLTIEYTGVNGPVNGPGNAYFGIWGSFFNAIFTFGTWLKENKDIVLLTGESPHPVRESVQSNLEEA